MEKATTDFRSVNLVANMVHKVLNESIDWVEAQTYLNKFNYSLLHLILYYYLLTLNIYFIKNIKINIKS